MSTRDSMHLTDEQLDDYADAVMSDAERASAEQHLAVCDRCRRALRDTCELLTLAARKRETVAAPPELWALIASSTIHLAEVRRAVIRSMRGVLVIGAIVLVAATAVVTWKLARWTAPTQVGQHPAMEGTHRSGSHPIVPVPPEPPKPPTPP
jgi:predicted anti-sigma-YlaC factor YlaD